MDPEPVKQESVMASDIMSVDLDDAKSPKQEDLVENVVKVENLDSCFNHERTIAVMPIKKESLEESAFLGFKAVSDPLTEEFKEDNVYLKDHKGTLTKPLTTEIKLEIVKHEDPGPCVDSDLDVDPLALDQDMLISSPVSGHSNKTSECAECDFVATTASSLKWHKESTHKGKLYPCNECDYAATHVSNLKRHKESKHSKAHKENKHNGIRYPCNECDYATTDASNFKKHKE